MNSTQQQQTVKSQEIGVVGKIIIPKEIENTINYLHKTIGATEWSGILFYKLTKGSISRLKDLEFTVQFVYPMNIGSSAYTEFEYNSEVMNAYDLKEELVECSSAMIHSHHNMSAFFSGTDTSELLDNCKHFNYYISLIVNFTKEYKCKIAFPSKTKVTYQSIITDQFGKPVIAKKTVDQDVVIIGSLDIEFEDKAVYPNWIVSRVVKLKEDKAAAAAKVVVRTYKGNNQLNNWWNSGTQSYSKSATGKQFLASLLNFDIRYKNDSVENTIAGILLDETTSDMLGDALVGSLDTIHNELYGNEFFFKDHCKDALKELEKHQQLFTGNEKIYEVIKENLEVYAL